MSVLDDLDACKEVISIKEEVEICETQLLEQIFDGVQVTHVDSCVKTENESEVVNGLFHVTEDNQTELNNCEGIREQPYECNLRPDDSTSSARKHDVIRPSLKKHTCSICKKSFKTSSRLKIHMNIHAGIRPYACTTCPRKYASRDGLREHILTHGSGFKCTLCEKSYKSRSGMNKHIKIHHGERNFQCEICSKSFTSKYLLSSHHKTHSDKNKYEGTLCSEKFAEGSKRLRHEKTHTNSHRNYYECENCKKYFSSEDQYRSHFKGSQCKCYASETLFECFKCENESFVSIELLNQHKIQVHPPPKRNHACSVCAKAFRLKSRLRDHMNIHTGSRPYACTVCPKKYSLPQSLHQHKLSHAEAKNRPEFKCTLCEKLLSSRTRLNSHMNMHWGERPFKCETCPKTFLSSDTLSKHNKIHSDDKKFECSLCNRKFNFNQRRRRHEKTHSNHSYNYQCHTCKKYFRLEDQYSSHLDDNKCQGYASENPFRCAKCDNETFASIELLNQHKVEVHATPKKDHACSICAKAYRRKSELDIHMNFHRGKRPFKCEVCSKSFWSTQLLLVHNKRHSNIKYKCRMCNKKFTDYSNRRRHEKMHSNLRKLYHCIACKKYFKVEDQFRSHSQDNKCKGNSQEFHDVHEKRIQAQNEIENIGTAEKSKNDDKLEKSTDVTNVTKSLFVNEI